MWEFKQGAAGETGLYAQKINSLGQAMWIANGIPIATSPFPDPIQLKPKITDDGTGGVVIAWIDHLTIDENIFAQRLNSSGIVLWSQNGMPIRTSSADKRLQNLIYVGNGDFILSWNENLFLNDWDLRAQKIDTTGNIIWINEGVVICSSDVSINTSAIAFDNNNSVVVSWEDRRLTPPYTIYCQKLTLGGNLLWQQNGISVSSLNGFQSQIKLVCDSNGNTIGCWLDARSDVFWDIYAQKFDGSGNKLWEPEGKEVCIVGGHQYWQNLIITDNEDFIVTWYDERNPDSDIYAQNLHSLITSVNNSTTKYLEHFVLDQNYPNPFNPTTSIKYAIASRQFVIIKVFDVLGNEIATLVNEEKPAGTYEVDWNATGLPSGVYFYQLKTGGYVETKKMILLR
jgi:hypothetical protein